MSKEIVILRGIARRIDQIRTGELSPEQIAELVRTGQCGPPQATQLRSWGSACPSGFCPPGELPEALGRWFAGDREGCRELPYGISFTAAGAGTVTVTNNSIVDMCPTRLMAIPTAGTWTINSIQFGMRNQLAQGPAPAEAFSPDAYQMVPMVPDCIRAGQQYSITVEKLEVGAGVLHLVFIGPAAG